MTDNRVDEPYWTPEETAAFLQVPVATLQKWAYKGTGPQRYRIGRHSRYRPEEIRSWARAQAVAR